MYGGFVMRQAILCVVALSAGLTPRAVSAATCDELKTLVLSHTKIDAVAVVAGGAFTQPGGRAGRGGNPFSDLPAFCRVAATLTPSGDSDIKIEVWLPLDRWNRKYQAVGNGAWNGTIGYAALADALRRGYATSATDTGHVGGSASFAMGHPEKIIDFAYRAAHEMTVTSKAIIAAFYGAAPSRAYWSGCSAGGRQALKEAQMFPADFDGIIAGSPGLDWSGRSAQAVRLAQMFEDPAARLSPSELQMLHAAVLQACDARDGLKDGLISDPAACTFDPKILQCTSGGGTGCLTPKQVEGAAMMYGSIQTKRRRIGGLAPGSEVNWTELGWSSSARATGLDHFRYLVFGKPDWQIANFRLETDVEKLEAGESGAIDARNPDLKAFFDRGGKLLMYHGWADPQISPLNATAYYQEVVGAAGGPSRTAGSYRLFMAPGMAHCGGGEGPGQFDKIGPLERWVETGTAPDRIVASHTTEGTVDRTRPLCPFPQIAVYTGTGRIDDAANFTCK
jgi:feruloyl esterase